MTELASMKNLIVDDRVTNIDILQMILKKEGLNEILQHKNLVIWRYPA
jgi:hypothetical protein